MLARNIDSSQEQETSFGFSEDKKV